MPDPIRVFVGTDETQELAQAVLQHSIRSRTKSAVEFTDLRGLATGLEGAFYTGFSFYRWAIPKLCGFRGRAIYMDADIVFRCDVRELWELPLGGHTHLARPRPERDEFFTSVMLLDCSRLSHWTFDAWVEKAKADPEFYRSVMWCANGAPTREGVGPLPKAYNELDEWTEGVSKVIHYTKVRDQPWKRPGHAHERIFLDSLRDAVAAGVVTPSQIAAEVVKGHAYPTLASAAGVPGASSVPGATQARLASGTTSPPAEAATLERLTSCPACSSSRVATWCRGRDRLLRVNAQRFAYARCAACGVVFESVRPVEEDVGRFYPEEYGPYAAEGAGEGAAPTLSAERASNERGHRSRPGFRRRFKGALKDFYAALAPGSTFLDYGCGAGAYLDRARASGCQTIGVDVSPLAREIVEKKGHRAFPADPAAWDGIPDASVHFVRMNHVLEHLYRPREALRALARKMAPGGRLHAALPNPAGWTARLFRSTWHGLDCPRHAVLYPPRALDALLRDEGFSAVEIVQEPLTKDHLRSWGYVLECLGMMRPGGAESVRNVRALRRIASIPGTLAVATGRADRIHALARR